MKTTPATKVKILRLRRKCPYIQENSPQNNSNVATMKNKADLVTASGI